MANLVTVNYAVTPSGPSQAAIAAVMASVPLPLATILAMGLRVVSDTFTGPTTRTIVLAFGPSVAATATCTLTQENKVTAIAVGAAGRLYVAPPIVSFTGGGPGGADLQAYGISGHNYPKARAYLDMQDLAITAPGASYNPSTTTVALVGGLPPALFRQDQAGTSKGTRAIETQDYPTPNGPPYALNAVSLVKQGRGYSTSTYVQLDGILQPGGHEAIVAITGFGPAGQILGLQVVDPGQGYVTVPNFSFIDPVNGTKIASAGTQAAAVPLMGAGTPATATLTIVAGAVNAIASQTPGSGYVSPPTPVVYDSSGSGSGAVLTPSMGAGNIVVDYPGLGMTVAPNVVLTPAFKVSFPDSSDQRTPFYNFPLFWALQQATASEVVPTGPFLS